MIIQQLRVDNCIDLLQSSNESVCPENLKSLMEKIVLYIAWYFPLVVKQKGFLKLSASQLRLILDNSSLRVKNEQVVCEAVLAWYKHDPQKRLVSNKVVKFREMSPKQNVTWLIIVTCTICDLFFAVKPRAFLFLLGYLSLNPFTAKGA